MIGIVAVVGVVAVIAVVGVVAMVAVIGIVAEVLVVALVALSGPGCCGRSSETAGRNWQRNTFRRLGRG